MKTLLLLLMLLLSASAQAEAIGLNFKNVGVVEFIDAVVKGALGRDYVVNPHIATSDKRITVSVKAIEKDKVFDLARDVLQGVGITLQERNGVIMFESLPQADKRAAPDPGAPEIAVADPNKEKTALPDLPEQIAFYRPRGKTVEFLAMVAKLAGASVPASKDKSADVLVFGGSAETIERTNKLLEEVDRAAAGLHVRAALVEFSDSESKERSFNLALNALGGRLGIALSAGTQLANSLTIAGTTLKAALSAIDGDNRFRYVTEPQMRVMDGETAKLIVGSEVPTRGAATLDKNGNPVSTVEYRTAGIVITVQPKVARESIVVKVGQQVSNFAVTTTSNIDSPTIYKREAQTTVRTKPGELIVLAGLDESRESSTTNGLAWLPAFFKATNSDKSRSQMILMLEVSPESSEAI